MTSDKDFVCRRCGACCRWTGCVKLSSGEAEAIAAFLQIPEDVFFDKFTRLAPDRSCLSLVEKPDGSCIFLTVDDKDGKLFSCQVASVKPEQCRNFPLRWNFPGWEKLCPGKVVDKIN